MSNDLFSGLDARVRFGKALAGCVVDCYVDAAGVEWVPLSQARDAAARNELRLEEENAALKALRVRIETVVCRDGYRDMTIAEMQGLVSGRAREHFETMKGHLLADERARIGRALLDYVAAAEHRLDRDAPAKVVAEHLRAEIKRVCPGEG